MQVNHNLLTINGFFENVEKFRYLGTAMIKIAFRKKLTVNEIRECLLSFYSESFIFSPFSN
jgi:hypothetical protein